LSGFVVACLLQAGGDDLLHLGHGACHSFGISVELQDHPSTRPNRLIEPLVGQVGPGGMGVVEVGEGATRPLRPSATSPRAASRRGKLGEAQPNLGEAG
jgi:hypothetical protein